MKLQIRKMGQFWWITGDESAGLMGPYNKREDAESDRIGVTRFYRHENDPEFIQGSNAVMEVETA